MDVYNREQQIDREEEEVGTRQMYTTQSNRQIERQLDREEEEKVGTDRVMTDKVRRQIVIAMTDRCNKQMRCYKYISLVKKFEPFNRSVTLICLLS